MLDPETALRDMLVIKTEISNDWESIIASGTSDDDYKQWAEYLVKYVELSQHSALVSPALFVIGYHLFRVLRDLRKEHDELGGLKDRLEIALHDVLKPNVKSLLEFIESCPPPKE